MTTLLNRRALLLLSALALGACSDAAPASEPAQDMLPPIGDMDPLPQADRGVTPTPDAGNNPVLGARELRVVSEAAVLMERGARTELRELRRQQVEDSAPHDDLVAAVPTLDVEPWTELAPAPGRLR